MNELELRVAALEIQVKLLAEALIRAAAVASTAGQPPVEQEEV